MVSAFCQIKEPINSGVLLRELLNILLLAYHCEVSVRQKISFVNGLQILLQGEAQRVGSLQVSVGLPEKSDVLPQLFVGFYKLILLPLNPFLVYLHPFPILLTAEAFLLSSHLPLLQDCSRPFNLKLQLFETPIQRFTLPLVAVSFPG